MSEVGVGLPQHGEARNDGPARHRLRAVSHGESLLCRAVTNMRALVVKYGPAPRAFLVVPLVGAFFIDFTNALIITAFVNWLR